MENEKMIFILEYNYQIYYISCYLLQQQLIQAQSITLKGKTSKKLPTTAVAAQRQQIILFHLKEEHPVERFAPSPTIFTSPLLTFLVTQKCLILMSSKLGIWLFAIHFQLDTIILVLSCCIAVLLPMTLITEVQEQQPLVLQQTGSPT